METGNEQRKVGKGNPPVEHQFKPGQSGNLSGRPPGKKSINTIIDRFFDVELKDKNPLTGLEEILTAEEILVLKQMVKAKHGDTRAFDTLMDRRYGKAIQAIDHTTGGEKIEQKEIVFRDYSEDKK